VLPPKIDAVEFVTSQICPKFRLGKSRFFA
jgi:hypothetical protein